MRGREVEIIRLLIENKSDLSINQVAKLLKKDYKNAHNIVTRLSRMQLVRLQPFGRSYRVSLISKPHPLILEAEYQRRSDILKDKNIAVMQDSFNGLKSKLFILLLFGSYAKKTQTKHSDIDLLFIVPDESEDKMEKAIQNITGTLPLKIHVNIFKESDFRAMKNSKEITVGSEAINSNIVLHGIEAYYEMIQ
jgi:predicted nucleotidyltransferase